MGTAKFEKLDLASFASVKQFLDAQMLHQDAVDVWILNAGMISPKYQRGEDGVESTLQVNFLSHQFLMDNILKSNRSNSETVVVSLSSWGPARYSKLGDVSTGGLTHITSSEDYPFILPGTYGVAKQASIRFAREIVKALWSQVI